MRREVGGGIRMRNTCTPMADACQCKAKTTTMKVKRKVKSLSRVRLFVTLWAVAYQAPPSMGFLPMGGQEYWSGLPFPSPGDLSLPRDGTQVSHFGGRRFNL